MAVARLVHVQSIVAQYQTRTESEDPCSLCPQAARSTNTQYQSAAAEATVSHVTYLSEGTGRKLRLLKKGNGNFAGDDAKVSGVCDLEELVEDAFFLLREV